MKVEECVLDEGRGSSLGVKSAGNVLQHVDADDEALEFSVL